MKTLAARILAEHPRIGVTDFFDRVSRQADQVGVPLLRRCIVMRYSFTHLYESLLDVAWVAVVLKIFGDLLVGEMTSEPGVPPEQDGIRAISQAVRKKSRRWRVDMPRLAGVSAVESVSMGAAGVMIQSLVLSRWRATALVGNYTSIHYIGVEHAGLLEIVGDGVLGE